jgi:hypothetical protein
MPLFFYDPLFQNILGSGLASQVKASQCYSIVNVVKRHYT